MFKYSKNYIITANNGYVKSFDYIENKKYYKYYNVSNDHSRHFYNLIIIRDKEDIVKLIEYGFNIRIWKFHTGELLNTIEINYRSKIYDLILWNNEYLILNSEDYLIYNLKRQSSVQKLNGWNYVYKAKKFYHPNYGECIITLEYVEEGIKLWNIQRNHYY